MVSYSPVLHCLRSIDWHTSGFIQRLVRSRFRPSIHSPSSMRRLYRIGFGNGMVWVEQSVLNLWIQPYDYQQSHLGDVGPQLAVVSVLLLEEIKNIRSLSAGVLQTRISLPASIPIGYSPSQGHLGEPIEQGILLPHMVTLPQLPTLALRHHPPWLNHQPHLEFWADPTSRYMGALSRRIPESGNQ